MALWDTWKLKLPDQISAFVKATVANAKANRECALQLKRIADSLERKLGAGSTDPAELLGDLDDLGGEG